MNPVAMTERLIDAAIYYEQSSGAYRASARKELNDARAAIEAALSPAEANVPDLVDRLKFEAESWSLSTFEDVQNGAKLMAEASAFITAHAASSSPAEAGALQAGVEAAEVKRIQDWLLLRNVEHLQASADNTLMMRREFGDAEMFLDAAILLSTLARQASSARAQEDGSKDLGAHPRGSGQSAGSVKKLQLASIRALQFLKAKHDKNPNAPYGWHMPSQRTARACRGSLERKGLVAIERLSPTHFRYRITPAGCRALENSKAGLADANQNQIDEAEHG